MRTGRAVARPRKLRVWLVSFVGAFVMAGAGIAVGALLSHATGTTTTHAGITTGGTVAVTWSVTAVPTVAPGASSAIKFTMKNPATADIIVDAAPTVTVTGTSATGCKASWFAISPGTMRSNGSTVTYPFTLGTGFGGVMSDTAHPYSLSMLTVSTTQSACAGGTVTLRLSVS